MPVPKEGTRTQKNENRRRTRTMSLFIAFFRSLRSFSTLYGKVVVVRMYYFHFIGVVVRAAWGRTDVVSSELPLWRIGLLLYPTNILRVW